MQRTVSVSAVLAGVLWLAAIGLLVYGTLDGGRLTWLAWGVATCIGAATLTVCTYVSHASEQLYANLHVLHEYDAAQQTAAVAEARQLRS